MAAQAGDPAIQFPQLAIATAGLCAWCSRGPGRASTIPAPRFGLLFHRQVGPQRFDFPAEKSSSFACNSRVSGKSSPVSSVKTGKDSPAFLARCIMTSPAPGNWCRCRRASQNVWPPRSGFPRCFARQIACPRRKLRGPGAALPAK